MRARAGAGAIARRARVVPAPGRGLGTALAFLALLALLAPRGGAAAEPPVFSERSAGIETLELENGLRVVLMPNLAQPMVGAYVAVGVGSAREDLATSGMSHMLEHLLFNGTETMTQEELYAAADLAGAYNNANTADFHTSFMMVLPAANLETGLRLQSQMLFHSTLPPEKFAKERGVVLGELVAARDDPAHAAAEAERRALWGGTSLELPTLGTRATIAHLDRDDTYAFYKAWYVPNNMTITLAGNFDRDGALRLVERYYGAAAPRPLPADELRGPPPLRDSRAEVRRAGRERRLLLAFAAPDYRSDDHFAFLVAVGLLEAEGDGLLARALAGLPAASRPEVATWWQAAPGFGRLVVELTLPAAGFAPQDGYRLVQDAVAAALDAGIDDDEVAAVVRLRETAILQDREQLRMTGIMIAEQLVLGGVDAFASSLPRLRAVTATAVAATLEKHLADQPCLAVLMEPEPAAAAAPPEAAAAPTMPAGMAMPPAMAEALRKRQAAAAPAPADTVYRAPGAGAPAVPVERSVLASGAVLVSQTVPSSDLMAVHVAARGRALIDAAHDAPGAVNLVHRLLLAGVDDCDGACLASRLRRLGAVVKVVDDPRFPMDDYYTSGRFSFLRLECPAASGPAALDLLAELATRATFTAADVERERAAQLATFAGREGSAAAEAGRLLRAALYGDHPLALPPEGTPESVAALTHEQLRRVYREAFAPANLIWTVISPLPHEALRAQLAASLPGQGAPTAGVPALPATAGAERVTARVAGEMAAIRLGAIRAVDPADAAAVELLAAVMSDRIQMDLRERQGLSYSLGASVEVHGRDLVFQAAINPPVERAAEGERLLREAVAGFDATTVTQEELAKIRGARSGRTMMRHLASIGRAYYLAVAELEGDLGSYERAATAYDRVTLTDLRRVASYLRDLPLVTVAVE